MGGSSDASLSDSPTIIVQKLMCGGTAGAVSKTLIAPLERVKILFQVNSKEHPYTGVVSSLKKIMTQEGYKGLYRGNFSSVIRVFPYAAIQFVSFDFYQRLFAGSDPSKISLKGNFFAGALAGATSVIFTYPLDVTRARMAVQMSRSGKVIQYRGLVQALVNMWKHEGGFKALYRGGWPTMIGIFPYAGINFFTYHTLKWYYYNEWTDHKELSTTVRLGMGSVAGILGQTAVYPLDVIRRRMQIDGVHTSDSTFSYKYRNTFHAFKTICETEGWRMLFRGLHINYIKVVPLVSISFTVNDTLRKWLGIGSHRQ